METIITQIKKLRRYKGYTQAYMGEKLHLSAKAYRKIENGRTKLDIDRLYLIAEILAVPITDLIDGFRTSHLQIRIPNKDAVPQDEISQPERKLLQIMIEAKGKEISFLQEAYKNC